MMTPDGRRAWALAFLAGAGMTMTAYAAVALYLLKDRPNAVLTLGLSAHVIIFVVVTGFAALLVKRTLRATVLGNSFEASDTETLKDGDNVTINKETPQ